MSSKHGRRDGGTQPSKSSYLNGFQKLGPQIYFYHPKVQTGALGTAISSSTGPKPDLVIICSWMAASARHIAKYTDAYLARYKESPTLLLRSSLIDVLFKPEQDQLEEIQPAIAAIQSVFGSIETTPRTLLHVFSNGGSWSASVISTAYRKATGGLDLPISALVLDSCPSLPRIEQSYLALSAALPKNFVMRLFGGVLIWILLYVFRVVNRLRISENVIMRIRRELNDPTGPFIKGGVPRVYICSESDQMVPISDVKKHNEEAKEAMTLAGLTGEQAQRLVGFEVFQGSPHVGHLLVDADRYWNIVQRVWTEGANKRTQADTKLKNMRDRKS